MARKAQETKSLPFVALLAAWLVPGAGHVYLGRVARGVIIFVVVSGLFWTGMAIGGVMTVDYDTERWWFAADMFTGVHGLAGWYRHRRVFADYSADPSIGPPVPSDPGQAQRRHFAVEDRLAKDGIALVHPTDTVARAYAGIAGLLNLMCIFDAVVLSLMGVRGEPKRHRAKESDE